MTLLRKCLLVAMATVLFVSCSDSKDILTTGQASGSGDATVSQGSNPSIATTTTISPSTSVLTSEQAEQMDVVTGAASYRMTVDNSFSEPEGVFTSVFIVDHFVEFSEDLMRTNAVDEIPESLRSAIEASLAPITVTWVAHDEVDYETMQGEGSGVLSLAKPNVSGDRAEMTTALECGDLCGIWSTYVLQRGAGGWTVEGTTGRQAIS